MARENDLNTMINSNAVVPNVRFEREADILDITHRHYEQHSFDNHLEIVTKSWRLMSFS